MITNKDTLIFSDSKEAQLFRQTKEWQDILNTYRLTYDYLPKTNIYLYQSKDMFRNNTDTGLLGNFIKIKKGDHVLDIGVNNGALLLYAAQFECGRLYGIDIQEEACCLAECNLKMYNKEATIIHSSLQDLSSEEVDVVLCNPPYFDYEDPRLNKEVSKHIARHNLTLTLDVLCQHVHRVLKNKGRFYMVQRANMISKIMCACNKYHMEVKQMQFAYPNTKEEACSVLLEIRKEAKPGCKVLKPIYI